MPVNCGDCGRFASTDTHDAKRHAKTCLYRIQYEQGRAQVVSDTRTVWVNSPIDGSCVGRFGPVGVDVHNPVSEQREKGECFYCTHKKPTLREWSKFKDLMRRRHGVHELDIERHKPRWLS